MQEESNNTVKMNDRLKIYSKQNQEKSERLERQKIA